MTMTLQENNREIFVSIIGLFNHYDEGKEVVAQGQSPLHPCSENDGKNWDYLHRNNRCSPETSRPPRSGMNSKTTDFVQDRPASIF